MQQQLLLQLVWLPAPGVCLESLTFTANDAFKVKWTHSSFSPVTHIVDSSMWRTNIKTETCDRNTPVPISHTDRLMPQIKSYLITCKCQCRQHDLYHTGMFLIDPTLIWAIRPRPISGFNVVADASFSGWRKMQILRQVLTSSYNNHPWRMCVIATIIQLRYPGQVCMKVSN